MSRITIAIALGIALVVLNANCYRLMAEDKRRAWQGRRRIPERLLFLSAICFGALGGTLAMYIKHHKTRHWEFRMFFPLLMMVQVVLVVKIAMALLG